MSLSPLSSGLYSSLFYTRYSGKTCLADWNGYRRNASSTCAVPSISSISGVTTTNIRSFGVRAGSIHVTRVSPSHSSISEEPWIHFALLWLIFMTHSRLISLIITKYEKNVSFFVDTWIRYCEIIFQHKYFNLSTWRLWNKPDVDHGNSEHKHAWVTLLKIMRQLTKISFIGKHQ